MADAKKKPAPKAKKPTKEPKAGTGTGGGPTLDLSLGYALRLAGWVGVPALALAGWCLYGWRSLPVLRHPVTADTAWHLALILGGAVLIVCVGWILLPLAHWVRRYPAERFATGSRTAWFVPMLAATPVWLALYLAVLGGLALGGYAMTQGLLALGLAERVHDLVG